MTTRHVRGRAIRHHPHRAQSAAGGGVVLPTMVGGYYSGPYGQVSATTGQVPPIAGPPPGPMQGPTPGMLQPNQFSPSTMTAIGPMQGVVEGNASPATGGGAAQ